jgi:hypothetical protein
MAKETVATTAKKLGLLTFIYRDIGVICRKPPPFLSQIELLKVKVGLVHQKLVL